MSTFTLANTNPPCEVSLPQDLTKDQLLAFPAFKAWSKTIFRSLSLQSRPKHEFHKTPFQLKKITVQSADWFGHGEKRRLGFLKLQTTVENENGEWLPGAVFMRGGAVGMLLILQPDDVPRENEEEKYVILTTQPRIAAGSLSFTEIPAGMLDDEGTFSGGAAREIKEETGLEVDASELLDMTALAMDGEQKDEVIAKGSFSSPGGCDEYIPLFLYQKRLPRSELDKFRGKLTGLRDEGERITLKVIKLHDLWKEGSRDGKTLAALALYEGLRREGKI
ncbi:hypothetical protein PRZ48_006578 [Zasmidium cellare]|uniref:Nudix hydrolase domain-containing protein n=1 Tax=Zasmidium cellare TaxID=395010 RepID=A0ABR0ENT4_ZASCE|nr:hypothetical protein PRZ48_006578 [Zasmidium cellare]